jgi:two-component system, cell cycle sensor histidine kinase and response regulator CckA
MHARSRKIGLAALATALATLFVMSLLAYNDWKQYRTVSATTAQAHRILAFNESLLRRMQDAETGQRGFLLTGQPEYLEPYTAALERIPGEIDELTALVAERPAQRERLRRLEELISGKLAELRRTIELRQSGGFDAALAAVETGEGKQTMDQFRRISQEMEGDENARWSAAWVDLAATAQRVRVVILLGAMLLAALVVFGGVALRRSAAEMELMIGELDVARLSAEKTSDLLRITLYSIGDGVITTDRQGAVQMINSTAERLTGYTESEARGRNIEEVFTIVNETTRATVENPVRRVLRDGQVVGLANHTVLVSKSGADIPIDDSGAPITQKDGTSTGVVLVFRDVSDRKKAEESGQRLAAIVENSSDAIIGKSLDGVVISWNHAAELLFGYSAEEMIGNPITRLIPPDRPDEMKDILERIRQDERVEHYETERVTKDGRHLAVSLTVSPIRDSQGHVVGASKIARDITGQRRMEATLRETQKLDAIGRLAGGVAHDFNNLLTVILGYATVLEKQLGAQDPLRKTAGEIRLAGEQAASVIGQLLAFSRKQMTQPRVLDLNGLVLGMRDVLQRVLGEDIELDVAPDASPCQVKADASQLTQAMMTLAVNARDAMPTGGKLIVETKRVWKEQKDLGRPAGQYILLTVTDTGTGMDADTRRHVFEPFFTTKEPGKAAGLGLSSAYGIVQQNGGWIDLYSEIEHGTAFRIYLPEVSSGAPAPASPVLESPKVRTGTILLVEDQAAIRMLAEDVLSEAGYRVLAAGNGAAALRLASEHKGEIDLLVTDVVMPEISGPDLVDKLLPTRPDLPVLFISGYTDHALLRRGVIEEGTALLQKPFLPETLLAKVDEMVKSRC